MTSPTITTETRDKLKELSLSDLLLMHRDMLQREKDMNSINRLTASYFEFMGNNIVGEINKRYEQIFNFKF